MEEYQPEYGYNPTKYEYKPQWSGVLLAGGFFGLGAVVFGASAYSNDRGRVINGVLALSVWAETIRLWILCCLSGGFALLSLAGLVRRLTAQQRIVFTRASIIVPRSWWSSEEVAIEYRQIIALSTWELAGQRLLHVTHSGGKHIINASFLPTKTAFEEVCTLLAQRAGDAQQAEPS
jgi:hypothetical protein